MLTEFLRLEPTGTLPQPFGNALGSSVESAIKVAVVKKAAKKATYIEPKVESFRRNKKGRKLMEQELSRLLVVDAERFKDRPIVDPTTKTIQTKKAKQLPAPMT